MVSFYEQRGPQDLLGADSPHNNRVFDWLSTSDGQLLTERFKPVVAALISLGDLNVMCGSNKGELTGIGIAVDYPLDPAAALPARRPSNVVAHALRAAALQLSEGERFVSPIQSTEETSRYHSSLYGGRLMCLAAGYSGAEVDLSITAPVALLAHVSNADELPHRYTIVGRSTPSSVIDDPYTPQTLPPGTIEGTSA